MPQVWSRGYINVHVLGECFHSSSFSKTTKNFTSDNQTRLPLTTPLDHYSYVTQTNKVGYAMCVSVWCHYSTWSVQSVSPDKKQKQRKQTPQTHGLEDSRDASLNVSATHEYMHTKHSSYALREAYHTLPDRETNRDGEREEFSEGLKATRHNTPSPSQPLLVFERSPTQC